MSQAMYQEAVEAIRAGQGERGRDLLTRLLRTDQNKIEYWFWMSAVVESAKEQSYCFQQILRLDSGNQHALQGLRLIGEIGSNVPPPETVYRHRDWKIQKPDEPEKNAFRRIWSRPITRIITIVLTSVIIIGLIALGVFNFERRQVVIALQHTKTSGPPPTFTSTPTYINSSSIVKRATPSPTNAGTMPLWALLEATYTPTPLYVNTPHPISEAYRIGIREFGRNNWLTALNYFTDAARVEADAPDLQYYIGETQRMLENNIAALGAYEAALTLDSNFAPAYLGRSRVKGMLDDQYDPLVDLDNAIALDPYYAEAYLAQAELLLGINDLEGAQDKLSHFVDLMPDSALAPLYYSQIAFGSGDNRKALVDARLALKRDQTLLPAYRQLAQAALANKRYDEAYEAAKVYVDYQQNDPNGWILLAQSQARIFSAQALILVDDLGATNDDLASATLALDEAESLEMLTPEFFIMRAIILLEQGDGQSAVNELMKARRIEQNSLVVNLGLGRALLAAGRSEDAYAQIDSSENLADDPLEQAAVLYWRALAGEQSGNLKAAFLDWSALLALDPQGIPSNWIQQAKVQIATATPSVTATRTSTKTVATNSSTPTVLISKTPTPLVSKTPTKTVTP